MRVGIPGGSAGQQTWCMCGGMPARRCWEALTKGKSLTQLAPSRYCLYLSVCEVYSYLCVRRLQLRTTYPYSTLLFPLLVHKTTRQPVDLTITYRLSRITKSLESTYTNCMGRMVRLTVRRVRGSNVTVGITIGWWWSVLLSTLLTCWKLIGVRGAFPSGKMSRCSTLQTKLLPTIVCAGRVWHHEKALPSIQKSDSILSSERHR